MLGLILIRCARPSTRQPEHCLKPGSSLWKDPGERRDRRQTGRPCSVWVEVRVLERTVGPHTGIYQEETVTLTPGQATEGEIDAELQRHRESQDIDGQIARFTSTALEILQEYGAEAFEQDPYPR